MMDGLLWIFEGAKLFPLGAERERQRWLNPFSQAGYQQRPLWIPRDNFLLGILIMLKTGYALLLVGLRWFFPTACLAMCIRDGMSSESSSSTWELNSKSTC